MKIKSAFASMALALMALSALALPSAAQQPKVLQGSEITESELFNALAPKEVLMRTFKPGAASFKPGADQKPASVDVFITFPTGKAGLDDSTKPLVEQIARTLKRAELANYSFTIEGHADPRGGPELNKRLSEARARALMNSLKTDYDISENRLKAIGKGDQEPWNPRDPTDPLNRRVTIVRNPASE